METACAHPVASDRRTTQPVVQTGCDDPDGNRTDEGSILSLSYVSRCSLARLFAEWTTHNARYCSRIFEANLPPAANPTPAHRGDRTTPTRRQVGDWTQELFRLGLGKPRLPLWITAAQPSLMEKSIYYNNVVLVCTGAGITPAVSIIERFAKRKNIHLMWMTRDRGMVRSNRCLLGRVSGRRRSSA